MKIGEALLVQWVPHARAEQFHNDGWQLSPLQGLHGHYALAAVKPARQAPGFGPEAAYLPGAARVTVPPDDALNSPAAARSVRRRRQSFQPNEA